MWRRERRARCCAAIATATRPSTATPRTTRTSILGLLELFQADRRRGVARLGARAAARGRTSCSGTRRTAAGSAPPAQDPTVLLRLKEDYDGAEPSASSVSVLNLLTLAHLTGDAVPPARRPSGRWPRYGPRVGAAARAVPMMLCAPVALACAGRCRSSWSATAARAGPWRSSARWRRTICRSRCTCRSIPDRDAGGIARPLAVRGRHAGARRRCSLRVPGLHLPAAGRHLPRRSRASCSERARQRRLRRAPDARRVHPLPSEGQHHHRRNGQVAAAGARGDRAESASEADHHRGSRAGLQLRRSPFPSTRRIEIGRVLPDMHALIYDLLDAPARDCGAGARAMLRWWIRARAGL